MTNFSVTYNTRFREYMIEKLEEIMNILSAISNWINKDTLGLYENRLQAVVIRCTSLISIAYYIFIALLFLINEQIMLGVYDFAGAVILCYAVFLTYRNHVKEAFWIYNIALVLLVTFQVVYVGWGIGFQHSIFLLIIVAMFTTYYSMVLKLIMSVVYTMMFCVMYMFAETHMPYVVFLNDIDRFMTIVTAIYGFGCLAVAGFYFSAKSSGMEKKLVEYSKTLEKLAFFDPLTGLYNRRQTISFLEKEVNEVSDSRDRELTVAIGDIDFFKKVNDVYGHECGDKVLKEIASIINTSIGKRGIAARWGGEEFIIIFPEAGKEQVANYINELVDIIRKLEINYNGYIVKVTMSFGIFQYSDNMSIDELINNADMNLYTAKKSGRDKVVF